ncbi:MAG: hypothetical protein D6791_14535 [Chloroflexi bacterium]|nr:MAG: hypothetical protein D6791_14535 [Chloroflexota bacterium]
MTFEAPATSNLISSGVTMFHRIPLLMFLTAAVALLLAACGGGKATPANPIVLAPESELPPALRDAPAEVKEAYRFAIANKELLQQIPCFCGCVGVGHTSNYACYVAEDGGPGNVIQFDSHAFG